MHLDSNKTGFALAAFFGGLHVVWSVLVALGWAQPLLDFIFTLHMIQPVYVVSGFDGGMAAGLIVVTAGVGYVAGRAFATIWNRIHRA